MKKLFSYFLQGLFYIVPIAVTIYVFVAIIGFLDRQINKIPFVGQYDIPGIGLVAVFLVFFILSLLGYVIPLLVKTPVAKLIQNFFNSAPLVRVIYTSVRDLMSALVGGKKSFGIPVLVDVDGTNTTYKVGLITSEDMKGLGLPDGNVVVYFPYAFSWLGDMMVVPKSRVKKIDKSSATVMKYLISAGVTSMEEVEKQEKSEKNF